MTVDDLVRLATARIAYLSQLYKSHEALGDVEAMARVEVDLVTTKSTLERLHELS